MKTIYNKITCCATIIIMLCAMSACGYSEDELTPSGDALTYKLPQGNNDYDQTIVDYYNKYGTYVLYKYQDKDAYWTPSGWQKGKTGTMADGKTGFSVLPTDPDNVKQQLSLIKELWFDSYSDAFLKAYLPVKILLCAEVDSIDYNYSSYPFMIRGIKVGAWYNYYNICVGYGDGTTSSQLSVTDKRKLKDKLNRIFVKNIMDRGVVTPPIEFSSITDYASAIKLSSNSKLWALGTLGGSNATPARDWGYFMLMMICHTEIFLNTVPSSISDSNTTESSWQGILTPTKDTNGLLKKRYNMVRNYYIQNYNIDLQQIGNNLNN